MGRNTYYRMSSSTDCFGLAFVIQWATITRIDRKFLSMTCTPYFS